MIPGSWPATILTRAGARRSGAVGSTRSRPAGASCPGCRCYCGRSVLETRWTSTKPAVPVRPLRLRSRWRWPEQQGPKTLARMLRLLDVLRARLAARGEHPWDGSDLHPGRPQMARFRPADPGDSAAYALATTPLLPPVLAEAVVLAAPRPPPEHSPAPTKRSAHAGTSAPTCSGGVVSVLRRCLTAFRGGPRLPAGSTRCHALS